MKDVIIRADRADGFVVRNLTTRGAVEHGIYIEETDGYRIERTKMFWAADYGNLTFTSGHRPATTAMGSVPAMRWFIRARPRDRIADERLLSGCALDQHSDQKVRPARQRNRLLGHDGQRGPNHEQPHLRQYPGSPASRSSPRDTPDSPPTACRSITT